MIDLKYFTYKFISMVLFGEGALEKSISEITEDDIAVWIEGIVLSISGSKMVVDDGSSSVDVYLTEHADDVKEKDYVLVVGRVFPTPEGIEIHADLVKKVEVRNRELYQKARKLWLDFNRDFGRIMMLE